VLCGRQAVSVRETDWVTLPKSCGLNGDRLVRLVHANAEGGDCLPSDGEF